LLLKRSVFRFGIVRLILFFVFFDLGSIVLDLVSLLGRSRSVT